MVRTASPMAYLDLRSNILLRSVQSMISLGNLINSANRQSFCAFTQHMFSARWATHIAFEIFAAQMLATRPAELAEKL